jgi:hypothetical protein
MQGGVTMELTSGEGPKAKFVDYEESIFSKQDVKDLLAACCETKVNEFRLLGYEYVTDVDIWDCVIDRYRKKDKPKVHQIVNDIMSLRSTAFMNWMTLSIYRTIES